MNPPSQAHITGWVLAGGQGSRMGGVDKGLQPFQGQALAQRALERLRPQVNSVCINANRHLDDYRAWGCEVYPDMEQGYAGPLMGFLTGLENCPSDWLLVVPCDCPFFPMDLASRLAAAATAQQAPLVMVNAPEPNQQGAFVMRAQPVFCLLHKDLQDNLSRFLASGGRKIDAWTSGQRLAMVDFNQASDAPHAFANANTWSELQALDKPSA